MKLAVLILPAVTTNNATSVTSNSAILNGTLTSKGTAENVTVSFEWGLTDNYTAVTLTVSTNATGAFSFTLTGLSPSTTYHFRAKAAGNGTSYGADKTFTTAIPGATVNISVILQGGSRLDPAGWVIPVTVKFFTPGANVLSDVPLYTCNLTTTKSGAAATGNCTGIQLATYDITIVSEHTLLNVKRNVVVTAPSTAVDMGTLLEGDANNDSVINISDFGILAIAFMKSTGQAGFDARGDFDRNGTINISDFGLLAVNFMKTSPVIVQSLEVKWLGHSAFLITLDSGIKIITDPYTPGGGLTYGVIGESADIVTVSHEHSDHNNVAAVGGNPQVVRATAEVKGIKFRAISTFHDTSQGTQRGNNTVICFEVSGFKISHLGDLGHLLSAQQVADTGAVDILLIPVGGNYTIDAAVASQICDQLKPKVIIPMHYKTDKCAYPIASVDEFLQGKSGVTQLSSSEVRFTAGHLPASTQIIVLTPAR